jgi:RNA polymerase sigma-70 factor (ECF subfamily)
MAPELRLVRGEDDLASLADDDLMLLAKGGRRDAFEVLVVRHTSLVLGTAVRFFGDRNLGREVAQDVFLMLWAERDRYRAGGKLRSFLVTMTFNRCRMVARKARSDRRKEERLGVVEITTEGGTPLDAVLEESRRREVQRELARLPDPMKEALIARFVSDLSMEEIARATSKPVGTVKSNIFRGLERLRKVFGKGERP